MPKTDWQTEKKKNLLEYKQLMILKVSEHKRTFNEYKNEPYWRPTEVLRWIRTQANYNQMNSFSEWSFGVSGIQKPHLSPWRTKGGGGFLFEYNEYASKDKQTNFFLVE